MNNDKTDNLFRLIKVQFMQSRGIIISFLLVEFIWTVITFVQSFIQLGNLDEYNYVLDLGGNKILFIIFAGVLCFMTHNVLCNDSISMLPGTIKSRYVSRIIKDHVLMLGLAVASMVIYCINAGVAFVAGVVNSNLGTDIVFSGRYMCYGASRYMCYMLMGYAICNLLFVLMTKMGQRNFYICAAVIIVSLGFAGKVHPTWFSAVYRFLFDSDYSFGQMVSRMLGSWLILMLLACGIAFTLRVWKRQSTSAVIVSLVVLYIVVVGSSLSGFMLYSSNITDQSEVEAYQNTEGTEIVKVMDVTGYTTDQRLDAVYQNDFSFYINKAEKGNKINSSDTGFIYVLSASEASEAGIEFDESALDDDHFISMRKIPACVYDGNDISGKLVDEIDQTMELRKSGKVVVVVDSTVLLGNFLYGDANKYISGDSDDVALVTDDYLNNMMSGSVAIAICNDHMFKELGE